MTWRDSKITITGVLKKGDFSLYLSIYGRFLCLTSGFSQKTASARFKVLFSPRIPKSNSHPFRVRVPSSINRILARMDELVEK
jgi:hypothetical protein